MKFILFISLIILSFSQIQQDTHTPEDPTPYIEFTFDVFLPEGGIYYDTKARIGSTLTFFNRYFLNYLKTDNIITVVDGVSQPFTNQLIFDLTGEHTVKYIMPDGIEDMYQMCYQLRFVKKIKLNNLDVSQVRYASSAFSGCDRLEEIEGLDKLEWTNLQDIDSMFAHCSSMQTINLGDMISSKITNMMFLFSYCTTLKNIQWNSINTENVQYMNQVFANCFQLEEIDLSSWDMSKVYNFNEIFWDNRNVEVTFKNEDQYNLVKSKYSLLDSSVKSIIFKE